MTLEGTLGRIGINLRREEVVKEVVAKSDCDDYHVFTNTPIGWIEKRADGRTIITKDQLMQLQSNYIGVPKPYIAERFEDGTFVVTMRK